MRIRAENDCPAGAVLDTSAVYAVLEGEGNAGIFLGAFQDYPNLYISAGTLAELSIVLLARRGAEAARELDDFLHAWAVETVAVGATAIDLVREGFLRFGKGRGSAAQLNFGDLFAYALARELDIPLFFTGNDFPENDVRNALDRAPESGPEPRLR